MNHRKIICMKQHHGMMDEVSWICVLILTIRLCGVLPLISISLPSRSHHQHQGLARSTSQNSPTLSKSSFIRQTHLQTTLHQQADYPTLVSPQMEPCSSHVLERIKRVLSISAAHKTTPCFHNTKPAIIQMESGWPSSVMTTTFFIV